MSPLGKTVRVKTVDGRALYGTLQCFTSRLDVILRDSIEQQPQSSDRRHIGVAVVPSDQLVQFSTPGLSGMAVQYSPFLDNRIALGTAANFGLVGNGKVFSLELTATGAIVPVAAFDTQDSVYGVAWSEVHENHLAVACGDGGVRLFDCARQSHPLVVLKEHSREAFSVNWSSIDKTRFCSSSWDGSIKLWDVGNPTRSVETLQAGSSGYEVKFNPHVGSTVASAHGDGTTRVWDLRTGAVVATLGQPGLTGECLSTDWNKYRPDTLASAGSDGSIRIWDLRHAGAAPVNELRGHQLAVKRVKWSPHSGHHLLSASYDMTAKVWLDNQGRVAPSLGPRGLVREFTQHTEFVIDCDWSLWGEPGWVATVSFDTNLYVWRT